MTNKLKWQIERNEKVVAVDIDGVLSNYPKNWVDYIRKNTKYKIKDLYNAKNTIPYSEYRNLKLRFRKSGEELKAPVVGGARDFLKRLKAAGYKIYLLTARPFDEVPNLSGDTHKWLQKNNLIYDGIVAGKNKHIKIIEMFPYLSFMVEDNAEIGNQVAMFGYQVFLLDNEYNRQNLHRGVKRIKNLSEVYF